MPPDLPDGGGDPGRQGVHGDLAAVDFGESVVAPWSSGESGSCPQWVDSVDTSEGGLVVTTTIGHEDACTDDHPAYRSVVVLEREDVPARVVVDNAIATVREEGRDARDLPVRVTDFGERG